MTDDITPDQIAAAWALVNAATKGPWLSEQNQPYNVPPRVHSEDGTLIGECCCYGTSQDQWEADAALIAVSRELLPQALTALEAERAAVEAMARANVDLAITVAALRDGVARLVDAADTILRELRADRYASDHMPEASRVALSAAIAAMKEGEG